MKKGDLKKKFGFTIIEVSLVLAIGGMILVMVFVALPSLRRSQRDAKRKDDISVFLEAVKKYQTNNRGALPSDWDDVKNYLSSGASFKDPNGENYRIVAKKCKATNVDDQTCEGTTGNGDVDYKLYVFTQATCDGGKARTAGNPRNVAVVYNMEVGGSYCANT